MPDLDPERTRVRLSAGQIAGLIAFVVTAAGWGFSVKADSSGILTRLDGFGNSPGIDGRLSRAETRVDEQARQLGQLLVEITDLKREIVRRDEDDKARVADMNRGFGETLKRIEDEVKRRSR